MKRLSVGIAISLFACSGLAQKSARYTGPIIDVHSHCYSEKEWRDNAMPNPITNKPLTAKTAEDHHRETLAAMKKFNIVKTFVSQDGFATAPLWKQHDPDRVMAGYGIDDPANFKPDVLLREIKAGRVDLIGEVDPEYWGYAPNDPRLDEIFAIAEEYDIPVGFHIHPGPMGAVYKGFPLMRAKNNSPLLLEDVILKHPKLRLYVMHAGWPRIDEMINMLYAYPQLYVDIAVIDWTRSRSEFHYYLKRLVDAGFEDRIMYGSDQMVWTDAIGPSIEAVQSAGFLSRKQKADIFYNNAVRFFGLENKK
jgi:predicted TIM-barrel fold metal-dependent hydrolase